MKKIKLLSVSLCIGLLLCACSTPAQNPLQTESQVAQESNSIRETEETTEFHADSPEEAAYHYIKTELVPIYGLSNPGVELNIFFLPKTVSEESTVFQKMPDDAQGLLSALVRDFNQDGNPDLLTLRVEQDCFVLDYYAIEERTCKLLDSYRCLSFEERICLDPEISLQDDMIIIKGYWTDFTEEAGNDPEYLDRMEKWHRSTIPVLCSSDITAVKFTENSIQEVVSLRHSITSGKESFQIGRTNIEAEIGKIDYASAEQQVRKALFDANIQFNTLTVGWEDPFGELLKVNLVQGEPILSTYSMSSTIHPFFSDFTHLYEKVTDVPVIEPGKQESTTGESSVLTTAEEETEDEWVPEEPAPTADPTDPEANYPSPTPKPVLEPLTDYEKSAYRFIQTTLDPNHLITDVGGYSYFSLIYGHMDWASNMPYKQIRCAYIGDLTGDGIPELMTFRPALYSSVLDFYVTDGDTWRLFDSYTVSTYNFQMIALPYVYVQDQKILACFDWTYLAHDHNGSSVSVLELTQNGVCETARIESGMHPGTEYFSVNKQDLYVKEGEMDYLHTEELAKEALEAAGIHDFTLTNGHTGDYPSYGLRLALPNVKPIVRLEHITEASYKLDPNNEYFGFWDGTLLREHLEELEQTNQ